MPGGLWSASGGARISDNGRCRTHKAVSLLGAGGNLTTKSPFILEFRPLIDRSLVSTCGAVALSPASDCVALIDNSLHRCAEANGMSKAPPALGRVEGAWSPFGGGGRPCERPRVAPNAARAPIERRNRELPGEGLPQSRGEPLDSDAALSLNPSEYKWSAAIARLLGSPFEHRAICWALQHLIGLIAVSARSQRAWPCTASGRFMSVFSSSEATGAWASLRCSRAPSSREVALALAGQKRPEEPDRVRL